MHRLFIFTLWLCVSAISGTHAQGQGAVPTTESAEAFASSDGEVADNAAVPAAIERCDESREDERIWLHRERVLVIAAESAAGESGTPEDARQEQLRIDTHVAKLANPETVALAQPIDDSEEDARRVSRLKVLLSQTIQALGLGSPELDSREVARRISQALLEDTNPAESETTTPTENHENQ